GAYGLLDIIEGAGETGARERIAIGLVPRPRFFARRLGGGRKALFDIALDAQAVGDEGRRNRVDNRRVERQARRARAPLREGRVNLGLRGPQRRVARDLTEHETAIDQPRERRRDRKSTRLNSSHVKSSYAVFCLKNKKIK